MRGHRRGVAEIFLGISVARGLRRQRYMRFNSRRRALAKGAMWIAIASALIATSALHGDTRVATAVDHHIGRSERHWVVSLNSLAARKATSVSVEVTITSRCGGVGFSVRPDDPAFESAAMTIPNSAVDGSVCDVAGDLPVGNASDDAGHESDDAGHALDDADGGEHVPGPPAPFTMVARVSLGPCPGRKACELGFNLIARPFDPARAYTVSIAATAVAFPADSGSCGSDSDDRVFDIGAAIDLVPDA